MRQGTCSARPFGRWQTTAGCSWCCRCCRYLSKSSVPHPCGRPLRRQRLPRRPVQGRRRWRFAVVPSQGRPAGCGSASAIDCSSVSSFFSFCLKGKRQKEGNLFIKKSGAPCLDKVRHCFYRYPTVPSPWQVKPVVWTGGLLPCTFTLPSSAKAGGLQSSAGAGRPF